MKFIFIFVFIIVFDLFETVEDTNGNSEDGSKESKEEDNTENGEGSTTEDMKSLEDNGDTKNENKEYMNTEDNKSEDKESSATDDVLNKNKEENGQRTTEDNEDNSAEKKEGKHIEHVVSKDEKVNDEKNKKDSKGIISEDLDLDVRQYETANKGIKVSVIKGATNAEHDDIIDNKTNTKDNEGNVEKNQRSEVDQKETENLDKTESLNLENEKENNGTGKKNNLAREKKKYVDNGKKDSRAQYKVNHYVEDKKGQKKERTEKENTEDVEVENGNNEDIAEVKEIRTSENKDNHNTQDVNRDDDEEGNINSEHKEKKNVAHKVGNNAEDKEVENTITQGSVEDKETKASPKADYNLKGKKRYTMKNHKRYKGKKVYRTLQEDDHLKNEEANYLEDEKGHTGNRKTDENAKYETIQNTKDKESYNEDKKEEGNIKDNESNNLDSRIESSSEDVTVSTSTNVSAKPGNNIIFLIPWTTSEKEPFSLWPPAGTEFFENKCNYTNCFLTRDRSILRTTDDVVILFNAEDIHAHSRFPPVRKDKHIYIFVSRTAADKVRNAVDIDWFFNYTFTYKLNSDIIYPSFIVKDKPDRHGNVIAPRMDVSWMDLKDMQKPDEEVKAQIRRKRKAVAWYPSSIDCNKPDEYVQRLQKELGMFDLGVDVFGECLWMEKGCVKADLEDCLNQIKNEYFFYLAFEASNATDYVTEQLLYALKNYAIPIVRGRANYTRFIPKGVYLDANEMNELRLAHKINELIKIYYSVIKDKFWEYFKWHNHYSYWPTDNEILCEVCALANEKFQSTVRRTYAYFDDWWKDKSDRKRFKRNPVYTYKPAKNYVPIKIHAGLLHPYITDRPFINYALKSRPQPTGYWVNLWNDFLETDLMKYLF